MIGAPKITKRLEHPLQRRRTQAFSIRVLNPAQCANTGEKEPPFHALPQVRRLSKGLVAQVRSYWGRMIGRNGRRVKCQFGRSFQKFLLPEC
ncbi:MAG: hypothetical protein K0Q60_5024 [Microvirga sp.]|nr:hypothetical protein [Microvirga sp.]